MAANRAVRSAQLHRPYAAFSTLQPMKRRPSCVCSGGADLEFANRARRPCSRRHVPGQAVHRTRGLAADIGFSGECPGAQPAAGGPAYSFADRIDQKPGAACQLTLRCPDHSRGTAPCRSPLPLCVRLPLGSGGWRSRRRWPRSCAARVCASCSSTMPDARRVFRTAAYADTEFADAAEVLAQADLLACVLPPRRCGVRRTARGQPWWSASCAPTARRRVSLR